MHSRRGAGWRGGGEGERSPAPLIEGERDRSEAWVEEASSSVSTEMREEREEGPGGAGEGSEEEGEVA
jgi:hypothetical protein